MTKVAETNMIPEPKFIAAAYANAIDSKLDLVVASIVAGNRNIGDIAKGAALPTTTTIRLLCLLADQGRILTDDQQNIFLVQDGLQ
jgi:hypothetical protein